MTTPARYPTVEEVRGVIATGPLVFLETNRAMVEAAINIERERVAKEAGEVVGYQYRYKLQAGGWSGWEPCDESGAKGRQQPQYRAKYETRALVVQNSAVKVPDDVKIFQEALKEARRAIGDHFAPNDCYATGPVTGNIVRDLVECPACSFIAKYDAIQTLTHPTETPQ